MTLKHKFEKQKELTEMKLAADTDSRCTQGRQQYEDKSVKAQLQEE
jgi:hypothetical protein